VRPETWELLPNAALGLAGCRCAGGVKRDHKKGKLENTSPHDSKPLPYEESTSRQNKRWKEHAIILRFVASVCKPLAH